MLNKLLYIIQLNAWYEVIGVQETYIMHGTIITTFSIYNNKSAFGMIEMLY